MRWTSWLPRFHQISLVVVGLDVGPEQCSVVLLSGSPSQPESVSCAERLELPDGWVAQGEVLQPDALGRWLQAYLVAGGYQPDTIYFSLDSGCVSNHLVTLAAGLSPDDVAFQLQAEAQSLWPTDAAEFCLDYRLDTAPAVEGEQRYVVQIAPRPRVAALQRVAHVAGLKAVVIESRHDAAHRADVREGFANLPVASVGLALQHAEAFGLALRAWHDEGTNFLPHRQVAHHRLRRAWWLGVAVCAMGGAFLAAGFAMVMSSAADTQQPHMGDVIASQHAWDEAQQTHAQTKSVHERRAEQVRWLKVQQDLQSQSLKWSRVLSQAAQGVWVASVKQQGTHWTVHGEALSSQHAHQLVKHLKALDIWAQAPEMPQLQIMPALSGTGLPVWQFRVEADLKVGM